MSFLGRLRSVSAFTLIELLVVVLILAVLIAVAAPSFLGQTQKAHDSKVKQNLAVAYKAAKADATDREGEYVSATFTAAQLAARIQASEPQFTVTTGSCPSSATTDPAYIVVDDDPAVDAEAAVDPGYTQGNNLVMCADPESRVWTLRALAGGGPAFTLDVLEDSAEPSGPAAPVVTQQASISPSAPTEGDTLSASASFSGADTVAYQWLECDSAGANCANVSGTSQTFGPLTSASVGKTYKVVVTGTDSSSGLSTSSTSNATSAVTADAVLPTVSITAPANGATVSGTITVSASASDNIGVTGVQFKLNGVNLGAEDTTAPYSVSWNTTTATNGSHSLTAVARDAAGNSQTSTTVAVTVNNALPYSQAVNADSPLSYWRFEETSGTGVADSKGLHNGTLSGSYTRGTGGALLSETSKSLTLSGGDALVKNSALLGTGNLTIEAWINTTTTAGTSPGAIIYAEGQAGSPYHHYALVLAGNQLRFHWEAGWPGQSITGGPAINNGQWRHVAATKNGNTVTLYVDGAQVATGTLSTTVGTPTRARIGDFPDIYGTRSRAWSGAIDELAVYNSALSASAISTHYASR